VLPAFQVVDANRPLDDVVDDVIGRIIAFEAARAAALDETAPTSPEADAGEGPPQGLHGPADRPSSTVNVPHDTEAHVAAAADLIADLPVVVPLEGAPEPSGAA